MTGDDNRTSRDRRPDGPIEGLADLRQVTPPPSLVARVMTRVAEPPPAGLWAWLRRPRRVELRLSPLGAAGGLTLGVAILWMLTTGPADRPDAPVPLAAHAVVVQPPSTPGEVVMVRFVLTAETARRVALAGDFNGWSTERTILVDDNADGTFVATVSLPPGTHQYMFVVDGRWITDPAAEEKRPDGFGRQNAVLRL